MALAETHPTETDRIERKIVLRAPRERVWRAITDIAEFSKWFSVEAEGTFQPGARLRMTSTHEGHQGVVFYVNVDRMDAPHTFSWHWHPGAPQPGEDRSGEPPTVVTFRLAEVEGGTEVTVVESGFDQISLIRRAKVFGQNTEGWKIQMASLERYIHGAA